MLRHHHHHHRPPSRASTTHDDWENVEYNLSDEALLKLQKHRLKVRFYRHYPHGRETYTARVRNHRRQLIQRLDGDSVEETEQNLNDYLLTYHRGDGVNFRINYWAVRWCTPFDWGK